MYAVVYTYTYIYTQIYIQVFTQTPPTPHASTPCLDSMSDANKRYTEQANTCPVYYLVFASTAPSPPSSRRVSTASFRKHKTQGAERRSRASGVTKLHRLYPRPPIKGSLYALSAEQLFAGSGSWNRKVDVLTEGHSGLERSLNRGSRRV